MTNLKPKAETKLQVESWTCTTCGNRWTHSQAIFRIGAGYSYAFDRYEPIPVGFVSIQRETCLCFRCLDRNLPEGWPTPQAEAPTPTLSRKVRPPPTGLLD